jgi:glyoxylase-like metal-dependent hydrolase (beta-lactamase superfamily II)
MPPVVDQFSLGPIGTNTTVIRSERGSSEAIVVDPSGDVPTLRIELAGMGARCVAILITHGHWDHLVGVADLAEASGAQVHMPEGERELLESPGAFSPPSIGLRAYVPDVLLAGGETIEAAGMSFEVVSVPGHSPAHIAYYADGALFSGDVLFAGSVGRTDLPGADWETLVASIATLRDR